MPCIEQRQKVATKYDVPLPYDVQTYIELACREYDVDPALVYAIISVESGYDVSAVNGNCVGLMQINARVHKERASRLGVADLHDTYGNVLVGIDIISEKIKGYGNISQALMAYNGGDQYCWGMIAEGRTSEYARKVLELYEDLKL